MLSYTQKVKAVGFRSLIKQLSFLQSRLCVDGAHIMVSSHNATKHHTQTFLCHGLEQVRNQEFFRAVEVSQDKDTSINI